MVGTSILGSWNSHWQNGKSYQEDRENLLLAGVNWGAECGVKSDPMFKQTQLVNSWGTKTWCKKLTYHRHIRIIRYSEELPSVSKCGFWNSHVDNSFSGNFHPAELAMSQSGWIILRGKYLTPGQNLGTILLLSSETGQDIARDPEIPVVWY